MYPLRIWMHLSYRLMLHGQERQAEQAQVKEACLTVTNAGLCAGLCWSVCWTVLNCVLARRASWAGRASSNVCEFQIGDGIFCWCVK